MKLIQGLIEIATIDEIITRITTCLLEMIELLELNNLREGGYTLQITQLNTQANALCISS